MADQEKHADRLAEHLAEEARPGLEQQPYQRSGAQGQVAALLEERRNALGMDMMTRVAYCDKVLRELGVDVPAALKAGQPRKDAEWDSDAAVAAGLTGEHKSARGPSSDWTGGLDSSDVERDVKAAQQAELDGQHLADTKTANEEGGVTDQQVRDAEQAAESRRAGSERGEVPRGDAATGGPAGRTAPAKATTAATSSGDSETTRAKAAEARKTTGDASGSAGKAAERAAAEVADDPEDAKKAALRPDPVAAGEDAKDPGKKAGGGK